MMARDGGWTMALRMVTEEAPRNVRAEAPKESLRHRELKEGDFWRVIPAFRDVTEAQFLDHMFQARNTVVKPKTLLDMLSGIVSEAFVQDATEGFALAPMALRVSPYLLSLIDWNDPYRDPLRRQFIPVKSEMLPDHPKLGLDSLGE